MQKDKRVRRYTVDIEKLSTAFDNKRRQNHHTWLRVSYQLGIAANTLSSLTRSTHGRETKGIDGNVLACVLMYVGRPFTDFVIENKKEVVNDAYSQQNGNCDDRGSSPASIG